MSEPECFYPNGNPTLQEDIPCGSGSAVGCCPLNWSCQSNGLCYLADQNYYGRYTCTDKNWGPGCPEICTYDHTAAGNEAVLECSTGSYCCNTNRPELSGGTNCCDASSNRFTLEGSAEGTEETSSNLYNELPPGPSLQDAVSIETLISMTSSAQSGSSSVSAADIYPTCDNDLGESSCGPICCASGQSCSYPGQCTLDDEPERTTPTSTPQGEDFDSNVTAATDSSTLSESTVPIALSPSESEDEDFDSNITATTDSSILSQSTIPTASSLSNADLETSAFPTVTTSVPPTSAPTSTPIPVSAATPFTKSPGFKALIALISTIMAACLLLWLFNWYKKRNRRPNPPETYPLAPTEAPNVQPYEYDRNEPPIPNPYSQAFPANQPHTASSSSLRPELRPDHDRGHGRRSMQPSLQHAPAQNPYRFPNRSEGIVRQPLFANQDQERRMNASTSLLPSYTSEDRPSDPRGR